MDRSTQLYEQNATGWRRGVYEDIKTTFRAPIVNWFFRALMANEPAFTRYMWGQLKPLFQTRTFGRYTASYRDAVLSAVEDGQTDLPRYRRADLGLRPPEWRELRGQTATFDIVAPRLALTFAVCDRTMNGGALDATPEDESSTAPLLPLIDRDRGRSVTMLDTDNVPDTLADTIDEIQAFHGLEETLPSVYRCLAQWDAYLDRAWTDLQPLLESDAFGRGCDDAEAVVDAHVAQLPYVPRLSPSDLADQGLDDTTIDELQEFVRTFNRGAVETVLPAIHVYAVTLDAAGERTL